MASTAKPSKAIQENIPFESEINEQRDVIRAVVLVRELADPGAPTKDEQLQLAEVFCREHGMSLQIIIDDETNARTGLSSKVLEAYKTCFHSYDIGYLIAYSPRLFGPAYTDFAAFQMGFRELNTLLVFTESHPPLCEHSSDPPKSEMSSSKSKGSPQIADSR